MTGIRFYAPLVDAGLDLAVEPALASWDKAGSSAQLRSARFVEEVVSVVAGKITGLPSQLALRLDIGLPGSVSLMALHDLDNYLFPLVPRLGQRTGADFVSVTANKRHAPRSAVVIGPAILADDPGGSEVFNVVTTASASTRLYKEQIRDQLNGATVVPGEAVALHLGFVVGPRRAWPNLWKATIDALGSILGYNEGAHEWNARDGRIVSLGLHCSVDPRADNEVHIAVRASPLDLTASMA